MSDPIYGGTAGCCLYWIDKNENPTAPTVSAGATFNVDDPTFWTNTTALSGIASGYCERLAVAKLASAGAAVVAGATATLAPNAVWTMGATNGTTAYTNNALLVARVTAGFELGSTGNALFQPNDASFTVVGSSAGSNYMKAVDSAIQTLVEVSKGYVKGANDTNAYTFATLAAAAVTRAGTAAGSAITTPVKDGGGLNAPFRLAYPVAWAKQRKWMLDELRYTGSDGVIAGENIDYIYYNTLEYNTSSYFPIADNNLISATSSAYEKAVSSGVNSSSIVGTTTTYGQYMGPVFEYMASDGGIMSPVDANKIPYELGFIDSTTSMASGTMIQAYCGEETNYAQAYRIWNEAAAVKISGGTDSCTVTSKTKYVLVDGADVTLGASVDVAITALSVSSGCTAHIPNNITASYINIMEGGSILPTVADGAVCNLHADAWYADYRPTILYDFMSTCRYTTGTSTGVFNSSYFVHGGTLTVPAKTSATDIYVTGTKTNRGLVQLTGSGGSNVMSSVLVGAYGLLSGTGVSTDVTDANGAADTVAVLSGGTATLRDVYIGELKVYSGGTANLERCGVSYIDLLDGATLNITGNSLTNNVISGLSSIRIGTFQAFPLQVQSGWNTFKVQAATPAGGVAYVTGVDSSAASDTLLASDVVSSVANRVPILGGTWHSGTITSSISSLLPRINSSIVWQAFSVLAINGGTAQSTVNHYLDFRVRQWPEDPAAT